MGTTLPGVGKGAITEPCKTASLENIPVRVPGALAQFTVRAPPREHFENSSFCWCHFKWGLAEELKRQTLAPLVCRDVSGICTMNFRGLAGDFPGGVF